MTTKFTALTEGPQSFAPYIRGATTVGNMVLDSDSHGVYWATKGLVHWRVYLKFDPADSAWEDPGGHFQLRLDDLPIADTGASVTESAPFHGFMRKGGAYYWPRGLLGSADRVYLYRSDLDGISGFSENVGSDWATGDLFTMSGTIIEAP